MADATGFEGFYRENLARIVRACALVTLDRSVAEDVTSEAFSRLWSRWGQIENDDHAGGYLFKTAMRLCAKEVRRRARYRPQAGPGSEDAIDRALVRQEVIGALARIPFRQRQAVVLRDWAGFDSHEAARLIGIRESTLRVHLARGRASLRESLSMEEDKR